LRICWKTKCPKSGGYIYDFLWKKHIGPYSQHFIFFVTKDLAQ
jgi:hypothetical protein